MKPEELKLIIKEGEGLTVEFKERYSPKIERDIVALANSKGGIIILGVDDTGKIKGENLTNRMKADITTLARNCDPAIHIKRIQQIGKIIIIEVPQGDEKPYSSSSGYYRRLDAVTQKMTQKEIRLVYKESSTIPFEERINKDISWNDISRDKIKAFFKEAGISVKNIISQDVLSSLKLAKKSDVKNAGVLFFAENPRDIILQCQMSLVAFKGKDRVTIYDRIDVQDDLLTQFNEAVTFLKKHLNVRSEIKGVNRQDICEIPLEALREAVANAIIHRDYSVRGTSIMVEVHEDRVVVSNPGGLVEGLNPRALMNISVRRNELIADIFARMDKVERIGTGIKRMRDAVKSTGLPYPKIKSDMFFTITFERPPYSLRGTKKVTEKVTIKVTEKVTENQETILAQMKANPHITSKELSDIIGISDRKIKENIKKLKANKLLKRIGSAKGGHWQVVEK
jgi:ATP-dependent DNA helicase RecG